MFLCKKREIFKICALGWFHSNWSTMFCGLKVTIDNKQRMNKTLCNCSHEQVRAYTWSPGCPLLTLGLENEVQKARVK